MGRSVAFDRANRELRTRRFYFEDQPGVVEILWFADIDIGIDVAPGRELAEITYADGKTEIVVAPPLCEGVIERLRNPIPVRDLKKLSQHLLSLEGR
jgi:hypothetical protein